MKLKLAKESNVVVIPQVELSGPKGTIPADLILDTGAAYTLISRDIIRELGCDLSGEGRRLPIVTANGKIRAPLVTLKSIVIQEIAASNISVVCHNIPEIIEVSGLLGLNFLKHFRTTIDYRTLTLTIE